MKKTSLIIAAALAAASAFAMPRKAAEITVSGYTGASTLENFPVLVRISPERIAGFSYADCAESGADISFKDANGNPLDFEIDTWDTAGESLVWVKVPSLSGNTTKITFYWKDSRPATHTSSDTWSGYAGVWHLNEAAGGAVAIADSTANGANGTAHSTSSSTADGKVGRARNITTNTGHTPASGAGGITIDSANMGAIDDVTPEFTVSMWARKNNANNYEYFISRKLSDGSPAWAVQLMNSVNPASLRYYSAGTADNQVANPNPQIKGAMTGVWHKYDFIWKSDGTYAIYIDGLQDSTVGNNLTGDLYNKAVAINGAANSTYPLCIGGTYPEGTGKGGRGFYGDMDEVRICAGVLSADWVAADYAQVNNASFITYGAAQSLMSDSTIRVLGAPFELGSPTPAYGLVANLSADEAVSLSMAAATVPGEGTVTNYLKGWKLEGVDFATDARSLLRSSSDAGELPDRCAYVHASYAEFTWLWDVRDVLGVGAPTLVSAGANALTLSADVTGIGYTAPSATLKFVYGPSPDAMAYTNVLSASVTAIGKYAATLTRLTPGANCYVKTVLETNDGAHDVAETEVVCLQTQVVVELGGKPGLIQAKYANKWYTDAWDIAGAADATRVLGAWAAHCGSNFADTMPWSSADGQTSFPTWGDNTTWGYVGYMYFENMTYTFGGCMDDNVRLYIDGQQVLDQSGSTLKTATWFPPNGTGWYPIEIRVGNGTGGYGPYGGFYGLCWNITGYTAKDTSANWSKFVDPGDGSLLRTVSGPTITASENVSAGALASVALSFQGAEAARTLRVAWGPVYGGDDPADWYATSAVATVPAGATSATWTPPSDWGSDSNLVARFYFVDTSPDWSNSIFCRDYSAPDIVDFTVDGTGGDTLVVSGDLAAFPGADCVLTVYIGDSPTNLDTAWTGLAGATRTSTGSFSLSLHEPDTEAARYLTCGKTYYVALEAVSGGQVTRSAVQEVAMSAAPEVASPTTGVTRRTVTFSARLTDVGAGASATIMLYAGTSGGESDLVPVERLRSVTDRGLITIQHTFDSFETTYYWQLRATAEATGGTTNFETRTAVASCKTLDTTTYTWKTSVSSGNWDDPANWTDDQYGDSLGYPQTTAATALFPAMTDASVAFRRALAIGTLNLSANSIAVRFTQGGASTNETKMAVNTLNFNGARGAITLDGVAISTGGGVTLGANRALGLVNGANLYTGDFSNENYNDVTVAGGSWFSCNQMFFGSGTITIDDSVVWTRSHDYVGRTRTGGHVVFKGAHPIWRHNNNGGYFFSNLANANVQLDFIVPVGGFPEAPIQAPSNQNIVMGNNGGNAGSSSYTVNVLDESPANFADDTVTSPLILWPNKGINKALFNEGHLPEDGAATDDAFAWGDASVYPTTLGVTINGSSHAGQLQVSASPEEVASAELSPAYGYAALAADATRTCTVPSGYVLISADKRAICTGWKLYDVDPATHTRTLADSGDGTTCAVTGNGGWRELEWQWRVEYRVSATAGDNGSAAVAEEWVADGGLATVTATPAAGYAFYKWTGDVDANYDKEKTLTFAVDGQGYTLNAVFAQIFYVSKTGSDANDGLSWATAKATIPAAVALSATPYVLVSNGVYEITSAIQLTKGAIIEGMGDRGAVIKLTASPPDGDSTRCAVYMNHADAALRNLAVSGSYSGNAGQFARGICIDTGGLVENCSVTNNRTVNLNQSGAGIYLKAGGVVRGCLVEHNLKNTSGGGGGQGGGIHMKAGLVENCVIRDNSISSGSGNSFGGGVYVEGGTLRNSLVAENYNATMQGSGVAVLNGTVENCTIVGNYNLASTTSVGLFLVQNAAGAVRNCIVWGNRNANGSEANWDTASGTACTLERNCSHPPLPGPGNMGLDPAFADAANGDYRLLFSAAVNAAIPLDWMAASTDLDGNARVFGPAPDLGCYERVSSSIECGFDVDSDGTLDTATVTATAIVAGADPGDLTFTWTFTDTDGNVITTNGVGLSSVAIPLATGLYDVSLSVTDGTTTASATKPADVRVFGTDVYVATDGGNVYPYATRATAATNLVDAIAAATDGTTVHIAPGWHRTAETLAVNVGARLVSDDGPETTTIFGCSVVYSMPIVLLNHANAILSGVTVSGKDENGTQPQQWSGISITAAGGTVTNCVVRDHYTENNSAACSGLRISAGTVVDCVFSNNFTKCSGGAGRTGGAIYVDGAGALVDRCVVENNKVWDGGISYGGGVYVKAGTVRNTLIVGNSCAKGYGGGLAVVGNGVARNCTVVRNTSTMGNGGIYTEAPGQVIDCLAWGNTANGIAEDTDDPGFIDAEGGDFHLNVASAAVDASASSGIGALDLDKKPRYAGGFADKGCFEYDKSQFSIGISYTADSNFVEDPVVFTAAATPAGTILDDARTWWTFDGTEPSASNFGARGSVITNALPIGVHTVRFKTVYDGETYAFDRPDWVTRYGHTVYLVAENASAAPPYGTPETAATNLMEAFAYAIDGTTLLIGDGTFAITAGQTLQRRIAIRSVNGPSMTTIDYGDADRRLDIKSADVVLDGLRLYRARSWQQGAAVNMSTAGLVTNCVFDSCRLQNNGGAGVFMTAGTVVDCVFTNCSTYYAVQSGAALYVSGSGTLVDRCLVIGTHDEDERYPANGAVCIGDNGGTFRNSVVAGSRLRGSGGVVAGKNAKVLNCTVTGNISTTAGLTAGVAVSNATAVVRNTIIWNNVNEADGVRAEMGGVGAPASFDHCVTEDPVFVGRPGREFLIRSNSPCRDAGVTESWMSGARDFYGNPRIDKPAKPVDIGAAECQKTDGTMLILQ